MYVMCYTGTIDPFPDRTSRNAIIPLNIFVGTFLCLDLIVEAHDLLKTIFRFPTRTNFIVTALFRRFCRFTEIVTAAFSNVAELIYFCTGKLQYGNGFLVVMLQFHEAEYTLVRTLFAICKIQKIVRKTNILLVPSYTCRCQRTAQFPV